MWYTDPDLTMQLERERQEAMIRSHQQRQAARRAQGGRGMMRTIFGLVGDAMVNGGERLRRRAQVAQQQPGGYSGISTNVMSF